MDSPAPSEITALTERERKLLVAVAAMAQQYLTNRDLEGKEYLDNLCMSAGEEALAVLAEYGLVAMEAGNYRIGKWTEAGREFTRSSAQPSTLTPASGDRR